MARRPAVSSARLLRMAGYEHVSYDRHTHMHTLRQINTGNLEQWHECEQVGLPYKNKYLEFIE
jgi:hypothetical protein